VLDLAATLAARLKPDPRELLATPSDLDRWLVSSGLASDTPGAGEADLQRARQLREAIYAMATGDPSETARKELNKIAASPSARPELTAAGALAYRGTAAELLATVARRAVELFGSADAGRIRQCEGDGCALLFLDLSRSGARRWCSMQGCGNRAKAKAFRGRHQ
jgi:predicted RNA-binding Zn ribbon-like protein